MQCDTRFIGLSPSTAALRAELLALRNRARELGSSGA
jgi:hypothetical protein